MEVTIRNEKDEDGLEGPHQVEILLEDDIFRVTELNSHVLTIEKVSRTQPDLLIWPINKTTIEIT